MKIKFPFYLHAMLIAAGAFSLTSCGDIQQDLYLKGDGSGKLEASFELGEMMSMMEGLGDLNMKDVTLAEGVAPDTIAVEPTEPTDPMEAIIKKVTDPLYPHDFDSLISLVSIMPDSVRAKKENVELLKTTAMRIQSPANSSDLTVGLVIEFKDAHHLNQIINHLDTLDGASMAMPGGGSGGGFPKESFMKFDADMKNGILKFDTVDYGGLSAEMGMGMPGDSLMGGEEMGMMEMMFGNSKIRSVIHVPGEVLSCSNEDAILTKDNRVIIEHEFMDIMKTGKIPGYVIRFTPKK